MLDFFTRPPPHDLYSTVIPTPWREYLDGLDIHDVLHLLMRSDPDAIEKTHPGCPDSLKDYIIAVRRHTLARDFIPRWSSTRRRPGCARPEDEAEEDIEVIKAKILRQPRRKGENFSVDEDRRRRLMVGMSPKKMHEVGFMMPFFFLLLQLQTIPPFCTFTTQYIQIITESTNKKPCHVS